MQVCSNADDPGGQTQWPFKQRAPAYPALH